METIIPNASEIDISKSTYFCRLCNASFLGYNNLNAHIMACEGDEKHLQGCNWVLTKPVFISHIEMKKEIGKEIIDDYNKSTEEQMNRIGESEDEFKQKSL